MLPVVLHLDLSSIFTSWEIACDGCHQLKLSANLMILPRLAACAGLQRLSWLPWS